jgi:hypothetical protein
MKRYGETRDPETHDLAGMAVYCGASTALEEAG